MRYECLEPSCRKVFHATARVSYTKSDQGVIVMEEYRCCPFCLSKNIDKISTPALRIESIMNVKTAEADDWIKKGYTVKDSYASSVTLVKYAAEPEKAPAPAEKPPLQDSQAAIDQESARMRKDLEGFTQ